LDDEVFPNIKRSNLYRVASQTPIMTCIETLGWIIYHEDMVKCTIKYEEGKCVGVYLMVNVQNYYKLREQEERINTYFVVKFYELHDTS
jgi:hypothetical protein